MKNECKVKNCHRIIYSEKLKLCNAHYQRYRLKGELQINVPVQSRRSLVNLKDSDYK